MCRLGVACVQVYIPQVEREREVERERGREEERRADGGDSSSQFTFRKRAFTRALPSRSNI